MPYSRYSRPSWRRRPYGQRRRWSGRTPLNRGAMGATMRRYARSAGPDNRTMFTLPVKQGAPSRLTVTLPYEYSQRVNPGVVTAADTIFMINNAADLNFSAAGVQQPRGYDQWTPFYKKYRVNYVVAKFCVRQRASHGLRVYSVLNNDSTDLAGDTRVGEMERASLFGITGSNQPPVEVTRTYYPASAMGVTRDQYQGDEDTAGAVAAGPVELVYLHLVCAQQDLATACDFEFTVEMQVNITFYDRIEIGAS